MTPKLQALTKICSLSDHFGGKKCAEKSLDVKNHVNTHTCRGESEKDLSRNSGITCYSLETVFQYTICPNSPNPRRDCP